MTNEPLFPCRQFPPDPPGAEGLRRVVESIAAAGLLLCLSPLLLTVAVLVKLDSPGPVLFRQQRVGKNHKPFWMLKFRSMRDGAEWLRPAVAPVSSSPVFKLSHDPRVTRVGRILRRFSLDELPQLVNVLRGEMHLVGPRPLPVSDLRRFEESWRAGKMPPALVEWHRQRAAVKPGITGLWQVCARNRLDLDAWVHYDTRYVRCRSLRLDLAILLRTPAAALTRRNV